MGNQDDITMLRVHQVAELMSLKSEQTIWKWVREGNFPKPIRIGARCTVWRASDIRAWIDRQSKDTPPRQWTRRYKPKDEAA